MHWYEDQKVVRSLPHLYRICAVYCQICAKLAGGRVRGSRPLLVSLVAISKAMKGQKSTSIDIDGTILWVDLYDPRIMFAMDEAYGTGIDFQIIKSVLRPGDLFIDVGANHGTYALTAARVVGPTGKVVAFEPQPHLAALIEKSYQANNFDFCEVHALACSDHEGTVDFYIPEAWSGAATLYQSQAKKMRCRKVEVQLVTLDSLLSSTIQTLTPNVRVFLKVDAEGSEVAALRGAEALIRTRKPWIHFELNPDTAYAANQNQDGVLELLSGWGYRTFAEVEQFPKTITLEQVNRSHQRNLMAIPDGQA